MINSCKIHRKMWFYVADHGKTFRVYYEVFQKAGKFKHFIQFLHFYCFFHVILVKRCALVNFQTKSQIWWKIVVLSKKICYFNSKTTLYHKMKHVKLTKYYSFSFTINFIKKWNISFYKWEFVGNCCISCKHAIS